MKFSISVLNLNNSKKSITKEKLGTKNWGQVDYSLGTMVMVGTIIYMDIQGAFKNQYSCRVYTDSNGTLIRLGEEYYAEAGKALATGKEALKLMNEDKELYDFMVKIYHPEQ